jgi:hypothetical protein
MKAKAPAAKANGSGRVNFKVSLELPAGVKAKALQEYIADAVRAHRGGLRPSDPLFDLDRDTVKVTRIYDSHQ